MRAPCKNASSQRCNAFLPGERLLGQNSRPRHRESLWIAHAIGRSPSSIAEAFFNLSATSGQESPANPRELLREQQPDPQYPHGPDAVVSFLSDDIVAAAFEHARNLRTPEEAIDVNLDLCLQAAHTRCPVPVDPGDPEKPPPFLDTFAERALKYAGVSEYEVLSSVSVSPTEHIARYNVVMSSGEKACLTFQLAWESIVRAAYRGIATENAWALKRVQGESTVLMDDPNPSMGPEGSLQQHLNALATGDIAAAFNFLAKSAHEGDDPLQSFSNQLQSPLFRPLLSHVSAQVVTSRHSTSHKMSSIVRVIPDPRRVHPHAAQSGVNSSDALFYFTLTSEFATSDGAKSSGVEDGNEGGWCITEVKVVPVQFVNAWPRRW